jgi:hypothetical protein
MEYRATLADELDFLVQQSTFAELVFDNNESLLPAEEQPFTASLRNLFGCSFEGLVLSLARVWDRDEKHLNLISLPNLVLHFADYRYLGCRGLGEGQADRLQYEDLFSHPIRARIRTARTEILAHNVRLGTSKDRQKSDIQARNGFDLVNGEILSFCNETMHLLYSLNRQLRLSGKYHDTALDELKAKCRHDHVQLLQRFVQNLVERG